MRARLDFGGFGTLWLTRRRSGRICSHGLKSKLSPLLIEVFKTGVLYQFIHTLAILACGVLLQLNLPIKAQKYFFNAAVCFIIGVLCFSGSLYALALTGIHWFGR